MNLNNDLHFNFNFDWMVIVRLLSRYRVFLTILVVIGLFGFTGYQLSGLFAVQPDQAYLTQQQATAKIPNLKSNKTVIDQIKQLQPGGDTSIPLTVGTQNPFSLGQ